MIDNIIFSFTLPKSSINYKKQKKKLVQSIYVVQVSFKLLFTMKNKILMSLMFTVKILFLLFLKKEIYLVNCNIANTSCTNNLNCNSGSNDCSDQNDVSCNCIGKYKDDTCNENENVCYSKFGGYLCNKLDSLATCNSNDKNDIKCKCNDDTRYTGDFCQYKVESYNKASGLINSDAGMNILKSSYGQPYIMKDAFPYFLSETGASNEELSKLSWDLKDLLVYTRFDKREYDKNVFIKKSFDPALGNCYTFNHHQLNESVRTYYKKLVYGFELVLQLNINDMLPWVESPHFKVFIHNRNEIISKQNINYKADMSRKNFYFVTNSEVVKLPKPYSSCVKNNQIGKKKFYFDGSFSENGCYVSCYMDYINKHCGCQDPVYGINSKLNRNCLLNDRDCIEQIMKKKGDPVYWKECKCSVPCHYIDYQVLYSMAPYLKWMAECTAFNQQNMHPETDSRSVSCQNNWNDRAWIQVTLGDTVRTYNVESAKMPLTDFLTIVGALTGALIGLSIVTVFELVILFFQLCKIL
uniref:EGF-like domain-containing protein n=1 Tax=Strongyloides papillosus TaxID=174720 RepID=A0A0N5B3D9_STREA